MYLFIPRNPRKHIDRISFQWIFKTYNDKIENFFKQTIHQNILFVLHRKEILLFALFLVLILLHLFLFFGQLVLCSVHGVQMYCTVCTEYKCTVQCARSTNVLCSVHGVQMYCTMCTEYKCTVQCARSTNVLCSVHGVQMTDLKCDFNAMSAQTILSDNYF